MKRLLSNHCIKNNIKIRSWLISRLKSDVTFNDENLRILTPSRRKDLNKYSLNKILCAKDENTKQKILRKMKYLSNERKVNEITINLLEKPSMIKPQLTAENTVKICCVPEPERIKCPTNIENNMPSQIDGNSRPIRRDEPGEVVWGFIPKEWVSFFVPITGHSGFYTLLVTLGTYLFSKEIYVCDHEYYNGISLAILCVYAVKTYGPAVAKSLDKEINDYERSLNKWKEESKQNLKDAIEYEKQSQECMEAQQILVDAKRENVHLQREAEFRRRQMEVYDNVTRILNFHVEQENVRRSIQHKNLIQWVTKEVEKSLTPELKDQYIKLCLADINEIFKKHTK